MLSRAALLNRAHHPDADRTQDRASSIIHNVIHIKGAVGEARQTPVAGQLAQLNEARQREATQRRGAQTPAQAARSKEAQGDEHGDIEEKLRIHGRCEAAQTHTGSQIPCLLPAPAHVETRVVQLGVRDAIGRANRGQRQRKNRSKEQRKGRSQQVLADAVRSTGLLGAQAHTNEPDDRECDSKRRNLDGEGANHVFTEQFLHAVCSLGRESELYELHLHICLF